MTPPKPILILPRTLPTRSTLPLPQPLLPLLRPLLRLPILPLQRLPTKFHPTLRLINSRQPLLQHLQPNILLEEEVFAFIYCGDDAAVLVLTVDVGANAIVEEEGG
jgi:hypothetical protein